MGAVEGLRAALGQPCVGYSTQLVILLDNLAAAGVPGSKHDIRLGDVVVGTSVVPLDQGAFTDHGFIAAVKSLLPPLVLLTAVTSLEYHLESRDLAQIIERVATNLVRGRPVYSRPKIDRLYSPSFLHREGCDCLRADPEHFTQIRRRDSRQGVLVWTHHGLIGSGNSVIKDARTRDEHAKRHNVLCVEMEAAGVMEFTCCLPIRGISDYADGHKNDSWQPYAALAAAVYAKELLKVMSAGEIERCVLDVAGNVLESFISGAVSSASSRSAGSSPRSAQYVMEGLLDRHEFVQTLLDGPIEKLGDQSHIEIEDIQKVQALHDCQTRIEEALKRLGAKVDQQAKATSDYVTRAEWEKLEAQVKENTSRIETLSTTTQNTLDTTARLMNGLGDHLNKKELHFVATILHSAKEYTSHLTEFRKGWFERGRGSKVSETNMLSPPSSTEPWRPPRIPPKKAELLSPERPGTGAFSKSPPSNSSQLAGPEPRPPTPPFASTTSLCKGFSRKIIAFKETCFRASTPAAESRPKISADSRPISAHEPITSPSLPHLLDTPVTRGGLHPEGYDLPHRPSALQPPLIPQRSSPRTQTGGSDISSRTSPSNRANQTMQSRERHTPSSQHNTGDSDSSDIMLSSDYLPEQLNGEREESEYKWQPVKEMLVKFEKPSCKK
ncbi:hypothetical protein BDV11DRAFT_173706 [Aspergillus similis]